MLCVITQRVARCVTYSRMIIERGELYLITVNDLTDEQRELLIQVQSGKNVLVDACIGSGKTTAIQVLCNTFKNKKILYLTYNKLLKIDAQSKIKGRNVYVQNYHGFASGALFRINVRCGISDLIQVFNKRKPPISNYDLLVIDEYQDIEQETAEMLEYIKTCNPHIQIVAVGDMQQKIYDKTTLRVLPFMKGFLGQYELLHFTYCFRLCPMFAEELGRIWQKKIVGVNLNCSVLEMKLEEVVEFLAQQNLEDILCLGSRTGSMSRVLNELEENYPYKFNKATVYASIQDNDGEKTIPTKNTAIFTTYDSSKGLERKICVVFDYTQEYWELRLGMPMTSYEIMRNIFCVAASRGKEKIIFARDSNKRRKETPLCERDLSTPIGTNLTFKDFDISTMFDFKFKEDVEECFRQIIVTKKESSDRSIIDIKGNDELIDLSPCVGIYQEAMFFNNYDIDNDIDYAIFSNPDRPPLKYDKNATLEDKILLLIAYETYQDRYVKQVQKPFISDEQKELLYQRLKSIFTPDEYVQALRSICVKNQKGKVLFHIDGKCDVLKNGCVYELKFVHDLRHEHFLQCACYMIAFNLTKGILWNIRTNELYEITIPNRTLFIQTVIRTITKGKVNTGLLSIGEDIKTRAKKKGLEI